MSKSALVLLLMFSMFVSQGTSANAAGQSGASASAKKHAVKKSSASKSKASRKRSAAAAPSLAKEEKLVRHVRVVKGKKRVTYQRVAAGPVIPPVPPVVSAGDLAGLNLTRDPLDLKSSVALVMDQSNSKVLFEKNANVALPIASITKLMTSMVVVESHQNMDEMIEVTNDDIDKEKNSSSRLRVGSQLSRANMLHIALMSSENRAASALGRNYPGGLPAFVAAMNAKAKSLGMNDTRYVDSTGLSSHNVASAQDLAKLVIAAHQHAIISQYSTDTKYVVEPGGRSLQYSNSNHLVANPSWDIGLQKTGYINEAGRCLVMLANIEGRPIVMAFLDSKGKQSRLADAGRIRKWIEALKPENLTNPLAAPASRSVPMVHS
ncbi:D-alanyl-D-alanine endopeptidase [Actimicrobium antarcticum]|uniref:D-alanyl-D-alanine endopeptidase n=1 Tax=Actimicrobium antarcticum TaxID=1051899 RepID=A0ABP7SYA3_9BURK